MSEKNNDVDDREGDTRDDRFLSAVDADLRRSRKGADNRLFIALAVAVPIVLMVERSRKGSQWLGIALIVAFLFGLTGFFFYAARRQLKVADKYGLVCAACGYRPAAHMIMSAAMTQRCAKCYARLPLRSQGGKQENRRSDS